MFNPVPEPVSGTGLELDPGLHLGLAPFLEPGGGGEASRAAHAAAWAARSFRLLLAMAMATCMTLCIRRRLDFSWSGGQCKT